jgi:hypothetical protein
LRIKVEEMMSLTEDTKKELHLRIQGTKVERETMGTLAEHTGHKFITQQKLKPEFSTDLVAEEEQ